MFLNVFENQESDHFYWAPFIWTWSDNELVARTWDVPDSPARNLERLHAELCRLVGAVDFQVYIQLRQFAASSFCGLCSVRWIDHSIRGTPLPTDLEEVTHMDSIARTLFQDGLAGAHLVNRPWIWGHGIDAKALARLEDLLRQHGVPAHLTSARVTLLCQALGNGPVQQAMTTGQPWRALKALANQARPAFQLILPGELEAALAKKGEAPNKPRAKAKAKAKEVRKPSKASAPMALDPHKLFLDANAFVTNSGASLAQISLDQIGPAAQGVALCDGSDAVQFLKAGNLVSPAPLALVVLNLDPCKIDTCLLWATIRVVVRCRANNEPLLVPAVLIQLSQEAVQLRPGNVADDIPQIDAACVKISIFRDAVNVSWSEVTAAPIRMILNHLSPLVLCSETPDKCNCNKWHVELAAIVRDPILDAWRRQWLSMTYKSVAPHLAEIFCVNIRCPACQVIPLLALSGKHGLFIEPRSLDSRHPLDSFQVVWFPKATLSELDHMQKCQPLIRGLARIGQRLGIRVATEDTSKVMTELKPGSVFLGTGEKCSYQVGPLPFGVDRMLVTKLLSQWNWKARAMHPLKSVEGMLGTVWLVQSCIAPPVNVIKYKGGDVVISKLPDKAEPASSGSQAPLIAPPSTVGLCTHDNGPGQSTEDPWLKNDPWKSTASTAPSSVSSAPSLQFVDDRIAQALARLPAQNMEVEQDQTAQFNARVVALEQHVQSLTANQQGLELKIEENARKTDANLQHLQHEVGRELAKQSTDMKRPVRQPVETDRRLLARRPHE